MSNQRKFVADKEAILMALDQLSQTMEVMGQVVARLKRSVAQAEIAQQSLEQRNTPSTSPSILDRAPVNQTKREQPFSGDGAQKQSIVLH